MDTTLLSSLLGIAVKSGTSVLLATLGGLLVERSGILMLTIEGHLMLSALASVIGVLYTGSLAVGALLGMTIAVLGNLVFGFWVIKLGANQFGTGLAYTIGASGLAMFLGQRLGPNGETLVGIATPKFPRIPIPILHDIPVLGVLFDQDILTYVTYILVIGLWFFLFRTKYGIELRGVGEHPLAVYALGVNVWRYQYAAVIVGGALIGLGGSHLSLSYMSGWSDGITSGRGWIAVALVIFSSWHPLWAGVGALLFGSVTALSFRLQAAGVAVSSYLLSVTPYLATAIAVVLLHTRGKGKMPAALGAPFFPK